MPATKTDEKQEGEREREIQRERERYITQSNRKPRPNRPAPCPIRSPDKHMSGMHWVCARNLGAFICPGCFASPHGSSKALVSKRSEPRMGGQGGHRFDSRAHTELSTKILPYMVYSIDGSSFGTEQSAPT